MNAKPIFSELAERQTIIIKRINDRVGIRLRSIGHGETTNDVMVDGHVYTAAVSEAWLEVNLPGIVEYVVESNPWQRHIGNGQWE